MAAQAGSGSQTWLGYAPEATEGMPVAATDWVPIDADSMTLGVDLKRDPDEGQTATGSLFIDNYITELDALVSGDVAFPLLTKMGLKLLFLCALLDTKTGSSDPYTHTGALTLPKPVTLERYFVGQSIQYAGCKATKLKITSDAKKKVMVTATMNGIVRPLDIASSSNTYPADQPYYWAHAQAVTLLAAGAAQKSVSNIEVDFDWPNELFYGANGSSFPTDNIVVAGNGTGKFTKLFKTIDEWDRFNEAGSSPGALAFTWQQSASRSVAVAIPNAIYQKQSYKTPKKGAVTEDYDFWMQAPLAGATPTLPMSLVALNSVSTAYTTT